MEVKCQNLEFSYTDKPLIKKLSWTLPAGENVLIKGQSGSGKSSFLKLLHGSLQPQQGKIFIGTIPITNLNKKQRLQFRRNNIGYVHQENHLIEHWTVRQNLNLIEKQSNVLDQHLSDVNLSPDVQDKLVSELSGGEKQRVCILRLLLQQPRLALFDEPTAHLDDRNANQITKLIFSRLSSSTVIVVSHDFRLNNYFKESIDFGEINLCDQ